MINSDKRPWGQWEEYLNEPGYRVKRIIVNSNKRISLQKHELRSEYWVVVVGKGILMIGNETRQITQGDSVFIPKGVLHRIENTGTTILVIIETQIGVCVEEDIIRVEDDWGRVSS